MKNTYTLLLLFTAFQLFAQKTSEIDKYPVDVKVKAADNFTARQVSKMAIFPGCENFTGTDKAELQKCFSQNITNLLSAKLEYFTTKMTELKINSAASKLQFVVSKDGKLIQIQAMSGGNTELGVASEKAMKEIAEEIAAIRPALLEDGSPVNLVFQLPVRFQIEQESPEEPQYEWNELVMTTLKDENSVYEIRLAKPETFKVYEITSNGQVFLGNYRAMYEIVQTEPYKSIFEKLTERILITEGTMKDVFYRFYSLKEDPLNVHIYEVKNGQETLVEKINQKDFYFLPNYSELIIR